MKPKPGAELWYRDTWGFPTKIIVDYFDSVVNHIDGVNDRFGRVRLPLDRFRKTLAECEMSPMGNVFVS